MPLQRHPIGLAGLHGAGHFRFKRGIHQLLNVRNRAKAFPKGNPAHAAFHQAAANLPVQDQVRAAELVDRLLRIADQEELSGLRRHPQPVGFTGVVCREQQQELSL